MRRQRPKRLRRPCPRASPRPRPTSARCACMRSSTRPPSLQSNSGLSVSEITKGTWTSLATRWTVSWPTRRLCSSSCCARLRCSTRLSRCVSSSPSPAALLIAACGYSARSLAGFVCLSKTSLWWPWPCGGSSLTRSNIRSGPRCITARPAVPSCERSCTGSSSASWAGSWPSCASTSAGSFLRSVTGRHFASRRCFGGSAASSGSSGCTTASMSAVFWRTSTWPSAAFYRCRWCHGSARTSVHLGRLRSNCRPSGVA
mmetsp:Transcript_42640/g.114092  ORF Transcript_42640/g.114092 Transcript_42640/m.114092 type:complete len:258 (+) Transcript_42640:1442-2215(+)